jgi:osmotically-inducible protein OsmY
MKNNEELQKDVQDAIKWEPLLHAAEIGVTVSAGIVTLSGEVDSYAKKMEAETATKGVQGVKAIVESIDVKYPSSLHKKNDTDIAEESVSALKWAWNVPNDKVQVKVENGWVNLGGELNWNYQKEAAKNAIKNIAGIKGVMNDIKIKPDTHDAIEQRAVESSLKRNWSIDSSKIDVKVDGTNVTLSGNVNSIYQKEEAGNIAWKTPGIYSLDNNLNVNWEFDDEY